MECLPEHAVSETLDVLRHRFAGKDAVHEILKTGSFRRCQLLLADFLDDGAVLALISAWLEDPFLCTGQSCRDPVPLREVLGSVELCGLGSWP